ncbi:carbohydrate kinase family protein [Cryobacterium soli]|uniref:carbohydrate kinase family protein n=1 Tax=Cryobacterium soli TaxID=2220095 RepID=UPI000E757AB5|nr:carbohydrate kinase family protein [Cryobacterium soli]
MPEQTTAPALVCVGNLTLDEAIHDGTRSPVAMGGDAAYAALAARLYLPRVTLLAPVGTDAPAELLSGLEAAGVSAPDLPRRDLPTVRNVITYHPDGSRSWEMLASEADFDALSVYPADVPTALLAADGFVLSAMSLDAQVALTPWLRANSSARLYLDLQEDYLAGNREALFDLIALCDVFLPSEIEATTLAGTTDLQAAARLFQDLGPTTVVIKRAEAGSLVLDGDVVTEVPSDRVQAVDSTGAGDAFCGGFAAVHLASGDAVAAAVAGSRAARIAISTLGIDGLLVAATAAAGAEAVR